MNRFSFLLLAGGLLSTAPAWAADSDWERAKSAHERGDYTAELGIVRPLAEKGYPFAQFNLGVLYDEGKGVPEDNAKAMEWYRKAAEVGYSKAQINLGIMYEQGEGVAADLVEAYFWYALADFQGDSLAPEGKRDIAKKMTPAQIQAAEKKAKDYLATHKFPIPATPPTPDSGTSHGNG
ncbi:MAG: sel1 repeat family protein [Candidatus Competibacteraceae bacterium]|nr:sel1 repeat family protein [Candidatus Competibacteraceae bacterium]